MFAILFEALIIETQEEIHHFAGWEGGFKGHKKFVNKHFVNKLEFPNFVDIPSFGLSNDLPVAILRGRQNIRSEKLNASSPKYFEFSS